ncbi:MAG: D-alanine--D-alanine ligase [Bacteroidota bacterium]
MKTIGVFCGGFSSEFEISMKSASTILAHFPSNYRAVVIKVTREGWFTEMDGKKGVFDLNSASAVIQETSIALDGALIYTHGDPGENGKIQAYLDMYGISYINSNALASALSFDKWYCNQFLKSFEIPVAKSIFTTQETEINPLAVVQELGLPLFVKPTNSGSSYGISKVKRTEDLELALEKAFTEGSTVVIESFLKGVEVTCGVYRNAKGIQALPLTEIVSENEYFDYEAKYQGKSQEITPARISSEATHKIQAQSRRIYELLNLKSIARIDFMLVDSTPYVIEVNTTPGFSNESIVPKMLQEAGISYSTFWSEIFDLELRR